MFEISQSQRLRYAIASDGGDERRIDPGKRLAVLALMALHQKKRPHSYMSVLEKATWNIRWWWVSFVLLIAHAIFRIAGDSDDPITQRGLAWDIFVYSKKQAAQIHSQFPRKSRESDLCEDL